MLIILISENRQLEETPRVKVTTLTLIAWAFTRVWCKGVWRYLRNVDEVFSPRFFIVYTLRLNGQTKKRINEIFI